MIRILLVMLLTVGLTQVAFDAIDSVSAAQEAKAEQLSKALDSASGLDE